MEHGLNTSCGNVSGSVLRKIFLNEYRESNRLLPKLTETHFSYDTFQKMRVYLATQILSNSCSNAIEKMLENDFFTDNEIPTAKATAIFCKRMNDFFDLMNSKNINDENPLKRGLSVDTVGKVTELKDYIYSFHQTKGGKVFCLDGLKMTINAIISYFDENIHQPQFVLFTRLLNQDPLENTFGEIRKQTHNSTNPYLLDYLRILSRMITTKFDMAAHHRNVEWDQSCELSLIDLQQFSTNKNEIKVVKDGDDEELWEDADDDSDEVCANIKILKLVLIFIYYYFFVLSSVLI